MRKKLWSMVFLLLFCMYLTVFGFTALAQQQGFTPKDRERLISVETTLNVFMKQVDKRFEQMMNFLWILTTVFTTLIGIVIGFAYWDRRAIVKKAKDEAIEEIEKEGKLKDLIRALRKLAMEDKKVADVLRSFGLF